MLLPDFYTLDGWNITGNQLEALISLNPNHDIYQGHFPGQPVVPGVCLITIVKEVLEATLDKKLQLAEAKSIKFLKVVDPTKQPQINIQCEILADEPTNLSVRAAILSGEETALKAVMEYTIQ